MIVLEAKQLKHITHVEDLILNGNYSEFGLTVDIIEKIYTTLKGSKSSVSFQGKLDGAPAIIAGTDPETGMFFVGTKSIFNKTPKVNYTPEDVDANHSGGLADKLKEALKYLPPIWPKGKIFQGDFMFGKGDKKSQTIDGVKYWSFRPNTLMYAIPQDSPLGKQIGKAAIGIGWHTTYTGSSIETLSAEYKIDISGFKRTNLVWNTDTNLTDFSMVKFTPKESAFIQKELSTLKRNLSLLSKPALNKISSHPKLLALLTIYINNEVKKGSRPPSKKSALITGINNFITNRYEEETKKLKTVSAKEKKFAEAVDLKKLVLSVGNTIFFLFYWHSKITDLKNIIMSKLDAIERYKVFIPSSDGFTVTKEEGYVAIVDGDVVKLVDRLSFSKHNFNVTKTWSEGMDIKELTNSIFEKVIQEKRGKLMDSDMDKMENAIFDVVNRADSAIGSSGTNKAAFNKAQKDLMKGLETMKKVLKSEDLYSG